MIATKMIHTQLLIRLAIKEKELLEQLFIMEHLKVAGISLLSLKNFTKVQMVDLAQEFIL